MVETITLPKNSLDVYIDTLLELSHTQRRLEERMKRDQRGECHNEFVSGGILLPKAA
jgi:hypothetical protein